MKKTGERSLFSSDLVIRANGDIPAFDDAGGNELKIMCGWTFKNCGQRVDSYMKVFMYAIYKPDT